MYSLLATHIDKQQKFVNRNGLHFGCRLTKMHKHFLIKLDPDINRDFGGHIRCLPTEPYGSFPRKKGLAWQFNKQIFCTFFPSIFFLGKVWSFDVSEPGSARTRFLVVAGRKFYSI